MRFAFAPKGSERDGFFNAPWAHKIRNVLDKVRHADQAAVKVDLHAIMNAETIPKARSAARRFANAWADLCPNAVQCLRNDLDGRPKLNAGPALTCFRYRTLAERKAVRTADLACAIDWLRRDRP